jgi:hypothetical protein
VVEFVSVDLRRVIRFFRNFVCVEDLQESEAVPRFPNEQTFAAKTGSAIVM